MPAKTITPSEARKILDKRAMAPTLRRLLPGYKSLTTMHMLNQAAVVYVQGLNLHGAYFALAEWAGVDSRRRIAAIEYVYRAEATDARAGEAIAHLLSCMQYRATFHRTPKEQAQDFVEAQGGSDDNDA